MHAFVEVLGPGTGDAAAGVLIFFDDARYMFECGDGTQRYCTERSVRLSRLRGIYLTSLAAPSIGGLLGMVLTIADAGKERVTVVGPDGLSAIFSAAERAAFCYRPAMETMIIDVPHTIERAPSHEYLKFPKPRVVCDDSNLVIKAIPIPVQSKPEMEKGNSAASDANGSYCVQCYLCKLRDIPGKFNPSQAVELGVPRGPDFGRLSSGNSVRLSDGTVIEPSDVMSPWTPGPLILIISCPSSRHLEGITENPALSASHLGIYDEQGGCSSTKAPICVVYHLTSREVLADVKYKEWAQSFGQSATHVVLHASLAPDRLVFANQAEDLARMKRLDASRFEIPSQSVFEPFVGGMDRNAVSSNYKTPEEFLSVHGLSSCGHWCIGDCGLQVILAPVKNAGICTENVPSKSLKGIVAVAPLSQSGATVPLSQSDLDGQNMRVPACVEAITAKSAEVCFLGTAGAIPGRHRNVSAILLNMFNRGGVLLDCGEGSWGQLCRAYGVAEARRLLCDLKVVFISHIHADHHLGLLTLLHARDESLRHLNRAVERPNLKVIGPVYLGQWLGAYRSVVGIGAWGLAHSFLDAMDLTDPQSPESKYFPDSLGLEMACVEVIHCPRSYGVVIRDRVCQWKVVYSGDTRPCRALAEAGTDATLAIHEATLGDSLHEEALSKNHCTVSEALQVCGEWMGAWRTILTHFSQRYPRVPLLDPPTMDKLRRNRATVAFDLMKVNFAELDSLPSVTLKAQQAFMQDLVGLDTSSEHVQE